MNYILKLISKEEFEVTESEVNCIVNSKGGLIQLPRLNCYVNNSSISMIVPKDLYDQMKKTTMTTGRLHDGTHVVKMFGVWKDASNPDINLDLNYYPEISKDEIMTEDDWEDRTSLKTI